MFSTEDRVDTLIFYILVTKFYLQITHIKFSKEKYYFCGKSDRIFFFLHGNRNSFPKVCDSSGEAELPC